MLRVRPGGGRFLGFFFDMVILLLGEEIGGGRFDEGLLDGVGDAGEARQLHEGERLVLGVVGRGVEAFEEDLGGLEVAGAGHAAKDAPDLPGAAGVAALEFGVEPFVEAGEL